MWIFEQNRHATARNYGQVISQDNLAWGIYPRLWAHAHWVVCGNICVVPHEMIHITWASLVFHFLRTNVKFIYIYTSICTSRFSYELGNPHAPGSLLEHIFYSNGNYGVYIRGRVKWKPTKCFHSLYIADIFGTALLFLNIVRVVFNTCPPALH
jgi:hypothetical protein